MTTTTKPSADDLITTTIANIETRMAEITPQLATLTEEADRLRSAHQALTGQGGQAKRTRATRGARAAGDKPASEKIVPLMRARPGISVAEIAEELSVSTGYLYTALAKLGETGAVKKRGDKWVLGDGSKPSPAAAAAT